MGRITPDVGATDLSMCLSPIPNFFVAIASLFFGFFWIFVYIFNDRYHWLAFLRGKYFDDSWKKSLELVRKKCRNMCCEALKISLKKQEGNNHRHHHHHPHHQHHHQQQHQQQVIVPENSSNSLEILKFPAIFFQSYSKSYLRIPESIYHKMTNLKIFLRVFVFLLLSLIFTPIGAAIITFGILLSIMYQTLILWRGFYTTVELYIKIISEIIANIEKVFSPLSFLFYPVKYVVEVISKFKIDLSAVNVTCEGKYFY